MIWKPKSYHIELTNACIAKCPFCARTKNNWVPSHQEINLKDVKKFFTWKVLNTTTYVNLCWAFGDPIYAKDFLAIVSYFTENNVRVLISTNWYNLKDGFWETLGNMKNVKVTFWIDGITQKAHGNYRRWTQLVQVLKNAKKYINTWGDAVWQFLVFWNNEHEVNRAREISEMLWFTDFVVRDSRAYNNELPAPKFSVKSSLNIQWNTKVWEYDCEYNSRGEWYINASWQVLPCCYLGNLEYYNDELKDVRMNIRSNTIEEIISHAIWKGYIWKFIDGSWVNICESKCSKHWNIQRYSANTKKIF